LTGYARSTPPRSRPSPTSATSPPAPARRWRCCFRTAGRSAPRSPRRGIAEVATVAANANEAIAALATEITARLGEEGAPGSIEAQIANLDATKVTEEQALAISEEALSAVFGGGSANVKIRLVALATPSGYDALFEIQTSVTGADGSFKSSGLRLAVLTVSGIQVSRIILKADQTQFVGDDGVPFATFDAATKSLIADRLNVQEATTGERTHYTKYGVRVFDASNVKRVELGRLGTWPTD